MTKNTVKKVKTAALSASNTKEVNDFSYTSLVNQKAVLTSLRQYLEAYFNAKQVDDYASQQDIDQAIYRKGMKINMMTSSCKRALEAAEDNAKKQCAQLRALSSGNEIADLQLERQAERTQQAVERAQDAELDFILHETFYNKEFAPDLEFASDWVLNRLPKAWKPYEVPVAKETKATKDLNIDSLASMY